MSRTIDCLFIGHNEMKFSNYEEMVRLMGMKSGAYRDLNLHHIQYKNTLYTAADILNSFYFKDPADAFGVDNTFSATIAYLGTYLSRRGLTFDYVNTFQNHKEELAEKLQNNDVLAVAIPTTLYVSVFPILEIVTFVKKYNKAAKVIIGGPFIGTQVRTQDEVSVQYLFKSVNADVYINSSQGEAALAKVISALKDNLPLNDINNIYYKGRDKYICAPVSIEDNKLDENTVDWNLFADRLGRIAAIRTAISCPFSCSFCGFPLHAGKYQTASVEAIERELDTLAGIGRVTCLNFIDDTFNVPVDRFKEFLRMLIRKKYNFRWNCNFRAQFADREMVELMKESGCEGVFLGIESGSQQILQNMNKRVTLEEYRQGYGLLKEYGITTYMSFIIGFPGETRDTVRETVRFIEETQPTFFRTQLWYCDPFTPIWKKKAEYNIKNSQFEWSHRTMDSQTACDLIDDIFLSIKNSIWVPQNNFDTLSIYNLLHRGLSLQQVKDFLSAFNMGVREKLENPRKREVSGEVMEKLKNLFAL